MPSPFPGMNPWLEQDDVWEDFHSRYLPAIAAELARGVGTSYFVKIEQQLYIHESSAEERALLGRADVGIGHARPLQPREGLAGTITAPMYAVIPPVPETIRHSWIEIRDKRRRSVVTVIELLSPSNKRNGPDRAAYFAKRHHLLQSETHFVEIDLLRGGPRMPLEKLPSCDYYLMVSRAEDRPEVALWPVKLPEALPEMPVPLLAPDKPIMVNLQAVLNTVYDQSTYANYIYEGHPQPPLTADEMNWAREFLPK
jgi:hypothetical protein